MEKIVVSSLLVLEDTPPSAMSTNFQIKKMKIEPILIVRFTRIGLPESEIEGLDFSILIKSYLSEKLKIADADHQNSLAHFALEAIKYHYLNNAFIHPLLLLPEPI